jgi:hypothetical protein
VLRLARSSAPAQDMEAEVLSRELAEQGLGVKEATALPSVLEPIEYAQYPCSEPPACGSMASHLSTATARQWMKPDRQTVAALRTQRTQNRTRVYWLFNRLWPTAGRQ